MAGSNEELRATTEWRWVDERGRAMTNWKQGDPPPMGEVSDAKGTMRVEVRAIAALARQEEGREAVATVVSFTNGSYHRNYRLTWHRDVPTGTQLFVHADSGKDEEVFTHSQSECDTCGGMVACPRCDVEHPAPHNDGEGDAKQALGEYLTEELQKVAPDVDWFDGRYMERLVDGAFAAMRLATPTPQAADITAIAELREIMADESGEREALLVSFFRTTGAAMGRHGDAMGWAPEQTARHYLSEASK